MCILKVHFSLEKQNDSILSNIVVPFVLEFLAELCFHFGFKNTLLVLV